MALDLVGQRFGRLVVQRRESSNKRGERQWACRCDCGSPHVAMTSLLTRQVVRSCGCLRRDVSRDLMRSISKALPVDERAARASLRSFAHRYALTLSEAEVIVAAKPTGCDICARNVKLFFDHDHTTGHHRGWLCQQCNSGLGYFKDDPERLRQAADFLERRT